MTQKMKQWTSNTKIFVSGRRGMVGSGIIRALKARGFNNIIAPSSSELNLIDQAAVNSFFQKEKPEYVFVAAAKVGGIFFNNKFPADFLYENLMIEANVIHAAANNGCEKLLFLGSSCIYPKLAPQPMKEEYLLTGPLEPTNEGYALAKIVGLKLCQMYMRQYGKRFISAMPTNLYGVGDNFHPEHSHVIPGLVRRIHEAKLKGDKEVVVWGTGTPRREFLNVDDLSEALVMLMDKYEKLDTINVGVGDDVTIRDLALLVKEVVGFQGQITFDTTKPDGTPRKLLDVSRIQALGWKAKTDLKAGIAESYRWAIENRKFE